jgi:hypothetical protein
MRDFPSCHKAIDESATEGSGPIRLPFLCEANEIRLRQLFNPSHHAPDLSPCALEPEKAEPVLEDERLVIRRTRQLHSQTVAFLLTACPNRRAMTWLRS